MAEPISSDDERRLAERLRREADGERPAFSEALHRRIVEAVGATKAQPRADAARRRRARTWLAAALVASLVVAATIAVSQYLNKEMPDTPVPRETAVAPTGHQPPPQPLPQPLPEPLSEKDSPSQPWEPPRLGPLDAVAGGTAETVGNLVDATLRKSQWAYLDHDARVAADLVLAQLPLDLELLVNQESSDP